MQAATDILRKFPFLNSPFVERWILRAASSPVASLVHRRERASLRELRSLARVLVIADTNIGDSILLQPAVAALARHLPEVEVDYAFNDKMGELLSADPRLHRALPILRGGEEHHLANLDALRACMADGSYDLVVNFCPFFTPEELRHGGGVVVTPVTLAIELLRAYQRGEIAALPYHAFAFVDRLVSGHRSPPADPITAEPTTDTVVFVPTARRRAMATYLKEHGCGADERLVLVNPDTSNASTFLGVRFHVALIRQLLASGAVDGIVLAHAFRYRGIEREILEALDATKIVTTPERLPLLDFAALVDCCAGYVGGDTGPLHVAAARKYCPVDRRPHRNQTVVTGVFKATDPRVYGYDTLRSDMIDSSQDAPAVTFESRPDCKNLTCSVQRITATCPTTACHQALRPDLVARSMIGALADRSDRGTLISFPARTRPEPIDWSHEDVGESR